MAFYKFTGSSPEFFSAISLMAVPGYVYDFGSETPPGEPLTAQGPRPNPSSKWTSDPGPATDYLITQASDLSGSYVARSATLADGDAPALSLTQNGATNSTDYGIVLQDDAANYGKLLKINKYGQGDGTVGTQSYGLDIQSFPGAGSSLAIHHYSSLMAGIQFDNTGHQPLVVLRATENDTIAPGTTGTGPFFQFQSYQPSTFTDGVATSGSPTFTSATANFASSDVGRLIQGDKIPYGTYIKSVESATSVTLSANANGGGGTGITFTISRGSTAGTIAAFDPLLQFIAYHPESVPFTLTTAAGTTGPALKILQPGSGDYVTYYSNHQTIEGGVKRGPNGGPELYGPSGAAFVTLDNTNGSRLGYVGSRITVSAGSIQLGVSSDKIGHFGASGAAKQTVTGSRTDGTALASLLTALAAYGLVTDSSTA